MARGRRSGKGHREGEGSCGCGRCRSPSAHEARPALRLELAPPSDDAWGIRVADPDSMEDESSPYFWNRGLW